jgi:4-hydroxy-tetrahydrodipicolinate reductase
VRGHEVTALGQGDPLTPEVLAAHACAIDFTTPEAVHTHLQSALTAGARIVVGTTGWYQQLPTYRALAGQHGGSLLYGTNFSLAVQAFFRAAQILAAATPQASFSIREAHHVTKRDAPSGTALTLRAAVAQAAHLDPARIPIESIREADVAGTHTLEIRAPYEQLRLTHEAGSRLAFAEGAVLAAEWLAAQPAPGVWDFAELAPTLAEALA